jgi:hypothetical protein
VAVYTETHAYAWHADHSVLSDPLNCAETTLRGTASSFSYPLERVGEALLRSSITQMNMYAMQQMNMYACRPRLRKSVFGYGPAVKAVLKHSTSTLA